MKLNLKRESDLVLEKFKDEVMSVDEVVYDVNADDTLKTLKMKSVQYNEKGFKTALELRDANEQIETKASYKYYDNNEIAEERFWNGLDDFASLYQSKLNEQGDVGSSILFQILDSSSGADFVDGADNFKDIMISMKMVKTFDYSSRQIRVEKFISGKELYEVNQISYDQYKNIVQEKLVEPESNIVFGKRTFLYDKCHNLVEELEYGINDQLGGKSSFVYNDEGNQLEFNNFNADGSLLTKETFDYNHMGLTKFQNYYGIYGVLANREAHEYEFDDRGNWVVRQTTFKDGRKQVTKRKITYFE